MGRQVRDLQADDEKGAMDAIEGMHRIIAHVVWYETNGY